MQTADTFIAFCCSMATSCSLLDGSDILDSNGQKIGTFICMLVDVVYIEFSIQ